MSKQKELAKSTFIITIGKICTQFISFLLLPLYTEVLTSAEYGTVDIVITYTSLLTHVVLLGIDQAIFRFLVDVRDDSDGRRKTVSTALLFTFGQIALTLLVFAVVGTVITFQYKLFLLINIIASICVNMMLQASRGLGDVKGYAIGSFVSALMQILGNILLLVVFRMGVSGMLIAVAGGQLFAVAYLVIKNRIYKYIDYRFFSKAELKKILKYSLPLVPNALSWWVLQASDRTIVMLILGQSMSGQLTVAHKFSNIFFLVYQIFHMSWVESTALHMNKPNSEEFFNEVIKKMFRFFTSIGIGIVAVLPFVFSILVNGDYTEAYRMVPILILSVVGNVISALYTAFFTADKRTVKIAASAVTAAVINIVVHLLLVGYIGIYAAAVSSVVAFGFMAIYRYIAVRRLIVINLPIKDLLVFAGMFAVTCIGFYMGTPLIQAIILLVDFVICAVMNYSLLKSGVSNLKSLIKSKAGK